MQLVCMPLNPAFFCDLGVANLGQYCTVSAILPNQHHWQVSNRQTVFSGTHRTYKACTQTQDANAGGSSEAVCCECVARHGGPAQAQV